MSDRRLKDRAAVMGQARRVVVKVGSGVISSRADGLLPERISRVVGQIAALHRSGLEVVLVTSGAVAAGARVLGKVKLHGIPMRQAAAAAGQSKLIWKYEKHFQGQGMKVAQVLLTQDDVANRRRFLNARNTLATLLSLGVLPIVNENDSVVVDEIKFGDNDTLSSLVATVVDADLLVVLSDVAGLYDADPNRNPEAKLLPTVSRIDERIRAMAAGPVTREGTGGMITKVAAAERLARTGIPTLLIDGTTDGTLTNALAGGDGGTLFLANENPQARRKHWLANVAKVEGTLHLDAGAERALRRGNNSLLPSGISAVSGTFDMGAGVALAGPDGNEIGRGLSNYSAADIALILGHHSSEIERILGHKAYDEVVHRDNLALTD